MLPAIIMVVIAILIFFFVMEDLKTKLRQQCTQAIGHVKASIGNSESVMLELTLLAPSLSNCANQIIKHSTLLALASNTQSNSRKNQLSLDNAYTGLSQIVKSLIDVFDAAHISLGNTLYSLLKQLIIDIFDGIRIAMTGEISNVSVGKLHEGCRKLENCPLTNGVAVGLKLHVIVEQMGDAIHECEQVLSGIDGQVPGVEEHAWIVKAKTLVKTVIMALQKVSSVLLGAKDTAVTTIAYADEIRMLANTCSENCDDLVSSIDLPLDLDDGFMMEAATKLSSNCKLLIGICKQYDELKWFDLCESQISLLMQSLIIGENKH